ncbi:hypothetical protein [Streptomyces sp. OE57]|uniref:hypothetical protein n=1 Tax=Streptomyces lacaronensis TaxID=3379885 RepID=UPI0039B782B5
MRFASVVHVGRTIAVALTADRVHDLSALLPSERITLDPMVELLRGGLPDEVTALAQPVIPGPTWAPLVSQPSKMVAAPVNYMTTTRRCGRSAMSPHSAFSSCRRRR